MKYIDLFAGAGGLSEGFMRAGFEAVAHIEMNPDAVNTIKTRLCYYYLKRCNMLDLYNKYLKGAISRSELYEYVPSSIIKTALNYAMSEENLEEIFGHVDSLMIEQRTEEVDIIVGGPPCQAYSLAGQSKQRRDAKNRSEEDISDDERKYLYRLYCNFLRRYNPKMFVFENVPGLLSSDGGRHYESILTHLTESGYTVEARTLNSKNFGVMQNRKRIIIIGWRIDLQLRYPEIMEIPQDQVLATLFQDLPSLQSGDTASQYTNIPMSEYVRDKGFRVADDVFTWHIARPNIDRDREIYRIAASMWRDGQRRLKYQDLPAHLRTHKNTKDFTDRYKVVPSDMTFSHTVLAHISKDGHYYIHPDVEQARSLTVREAARIQSFPDSYFFEGSRTSAFTQIGNAVPPLMAEQIAIGIRNILKEENG